MGFTPPSTCLTGPSTPPRWRSLLILTISYCVLCSFGFFSEHVQELIPCKFPPSCPELTRPWEHRLPALAEHLLEHCWSSLLRIKLQSVWDTCRRTSHWVCFSTLHSRTPSLCCHSRIPMCSEFPGQTIHGVRPSRTQVLSVCCRYRFQTPAWLGTPQLHRINSALGGRAASRPRVLPPLPRVWVAALKLFPLASALHAAALGSSDILSLQERHVLSRTRL